MEINRCSYLSAFFLFLSTFSILADAHAVKAPSDTDTGKWHKKVLTVKWDSNWSTEYCMDISAIYTLKYRWSSEHAMSYDFHVHPNTKNNEYQTNYFSKSNSIKSESGEISTKKTGTYCFNFDPVVRLVANGKIELSYRLD